MSPRPGPRKATISVRLSTEATRILDAWALRLGITRRGGEPNRSEAMERLIRAIDTPDDKTINKRGQGR